MALLPWENLVAVEGVEPPTRGFLNHSPKNGPKALISRAFTICCPLPAISTFQVLLNLLLYMVTEH